MKRRDDSPVLPVLLPSLLAEGILSDDCFSEEEVLEIETALQEVARGEWVDFDEFRKTQNI